MVLYVLFLMYAQAHTTFYIRICSVVEIVFNSRFGCCVKWFYLKYETVFDLHRTNDVQNLILTASVRTPKFNSEEFNQISCYFEVAPGFIFPK